MQKTQLQLERRILAEAWYIIRDHMGIEQKDRDNKETEEEWHKIVDLCQELYKTTGSPAQEVFAKAVAMAIVDYYGALTKQ